MILAAKEKNKYIGFDEWKKIMRERIEGITSIGELFLYVNKPYSMTFLKYVQHYLSPQDYAQTLAECWIREEQPNMNPSITKTELTNMFKRADKGVFVVYSLQKKHAVLS